MYGILLENYREWRAVYASTGSAATARHSVTHADLAKYDAYAAKQKVSADVVDGEPATLLRQLRGRGHVRVKFPKSYSLIVRGMPARSPFSMSN